MQISDLLCRYPRTSISWRVFHQIVGFQTKSSDILNRMLCVVTLLASSVQRQRRRNRENERKKKSKRAAHFRFVAVFAQQMLSKLIEMAIMRSSLFNL